MAGRTCSWDGPSGTRDHSPAVQRVHPDGSDTEGRGSTCRSGASSPCEDFSTTENKSSPADTTVSEGTDDKGNQCQTPIYLEPSGACAIDGKDFGRLFVRSSPGLSNPGGSLVPRKELEQLMRQYQSAMANKKLLERGKVSIVCHALNRLSCYIAIRLNCECRHFSIHSCL